MTLAPKLRALGSVASAVAGAAVKLGGAGLYSSKSLLADGMTSAASLAALAFSLYYYRESLRPPDADHPYGHERLALASNLVSTVLYAAVAGFMAAVLMGSGRYTVSPEAPLAAVAGGLLYFVSIQLARGLGEAFRAYSTLSASELIESVVVTASSLAGATVTYLADLAGAAIIVAYVAVEVAENLLRAIRLYSDVSAPPTIYRVVYEEFRKAGLRVAGARIRLRAPNRYQGDVAIVMPSDSRVADVYSRIREARARLERLYNVDIVVHVEPLEEGRDI